MFVGFATVLLLSVSFASAFSIEGFSVSDFFAKVFGKEVQKSPSIYNVSNQTVALNRTHLECRNMQCVSVNGKGQNKCSSSSQCYNAVCTNNTCTKVIGNGTMLCSPIGGYCGPTHLECRGNTCTRVQGAGNNTCSSEGSSCGNVTHLECINSTCTIVSGNGTNQCSSAGMACNNTGNQSKPDLIIGSHSISNISGNSSHSVVSISTVVRNIGVATAGSSVTRIQVMGAYNITRDVATGSISAGGSLIVSQNYTLSRGSWRVYSKADQTLIVVESDENNNERTTWFSV